MPPPSPVLVPLGMAVLRSILLLLMASRPYVLATPPPRALVLAAEGAAPIELLAMVELSMVVSSPA
jgi:hypothetical protein